MATTTKNKPMPLILDMDVDQLDHQQLISLYGANNENLHYFASNLAVNIKQNGSKLQISSNTLDNIARTKVVIEKAILIICKSNGLTKEDLHFLVANDIAGPNEKPLVIQTPKKKITPANAAQSNYIKQIQKNTITFGIGPAGTGKTALAVAIAVEMLTSMKVQRLILVRPAVEAGENLGHLPGDLKEKVEPYHRPILDALNDYIGSERVEHLTNLNRIEIGAVAYMRGRTLNNAFVIFDEAQNATFDQLKMIITRLGFDSKMVINGDPGQSDLRKRQNLKNINPFAQTVDLLSDIPSIGMASFSENDSVRHPIVKQILNKYSQICE